MSIFTYFTMQNIKYDEKALYLDISKEKRLTSEECS